MKTNITLSLDTRRAKKDGTFPLIFRLSHHRKTISIATGISLFKKDWNEKTRTIKKSYVGASSVTRTNNLLTKGKSHLIDKIQKLEESGELDYMSIKEVKSQLQKTHSKVGFFPYTEAIITELKKSKKFGNANKYRDIYLAIKKFHKAEHLNFEEINYHFLKKFEAYHFGKGTSVNGLSFYLRTLRAVFNKAIKDEVVAKEAYPFEKYQIKSEPTKKRAIDKDKIKSIMELEFEDSDILYHPRNYFLMSYLMNGMPFVDMAYLKRKNIIDGRIHYRRQKTSKLYDLKITEQLSVFFSYYIEGKEKEDFVFPIIQRQQIEEQYRDVQNARSSYNDALKKIADLCGIEERLTSYVSRHSMATHLLLSEVPIIAISKMLGHSNLKTTQIYVKDLPTNVLDDYQESLTL